MNDVDFGVSLEFCTTQNPQLPCAFGEDGIPFFEGVSQDVSSAKVVLETSVCSQLGNTSGTALSPFDSEQRTDESQFCDSTLAAFVVGSCSTLASTNAGKSMTAVGFRSSRTSRGTRPSTVTRLSSAQSAESCWVEERSITSIRKELKRAARDGFFRRLRISAPTVGIGCAVVVSSLCVSLFSPVDSAQKYVAHFVLPFGGYASLLSLLPSDRHAVPCVVVCIVLPCFIFLIFERCYLSNDFLFQLMKGTCKDNAYLDFHDSPCWARIVFHSGAWLEVLVLIINVITLIRQSLYGQARLLETMWDCASKWFLVAGGVFVAYGAVGGAFGKYRFCVGECAIGVSWLSAGVSGVHLWKEVRLRVQSWLASRGTAATAAAGVAQLLGNRSVDQVLNASRQTFFSVSAGRIAFADFQQNVPNADLSKLADFAFLGSVDAFVSHSWHDDSHVKWSVLQTWIKEFKSKNHGREPSLWIDKYCINQCDIDTSLACLPVYLSGCKKLLILCGETYLQRLWCLVEVLVFLEMGAPASNLEVRFLNKNAQASHLEPLGALKAAIEDFEPRLARCTTDYDTERLRAVIEASGKGYEGMKMQVKEAFSSEAVRQRKSRTSPRLRPIVSFRFSGSV